MGTDPITQVHLTDPEFGPNQLFAGSRLTVGDQHVDLIVRPNLRNLPESYVDHLNLAGGGVTPAADEAR
jgi:hypothetical protein